MDSVGCLPMGCRLSWCDGCAGAGGGSTSIIVAFEPNANLPVIYCALAIALASRDSLCFVVLVGVVFGGLNGVASGGIVGAAVGLERMDGALGGGLEIGGSGVMAGGL